MKLQRLYRLGSKVLHGHAANTLRRQCTLSAGSFASLCACKGMQFPPKTVVVRRGRACTHAGGVSPVFYMRSSCRTPPCCILQAVKIALELKKHLVDRDKLSVSQVGPYVHSGNARRHGVYDNVGSNGTGNAD